MKPARSEMLGIGIAFVTLLVIAGSCAGAYHLAGGTWSRASSTSCSLVTDPKEWAFGSGVGCGPTASVCTTRVGPLEVTRVFARR